MPLWEVTPKQGSSADGGRSLAMQEVLPQDLTPPPPEKEFGLFFHVKEGVGRGNHSLLSAILIAAACHHPSSSPTALFLGFVCLNSSSFFLEVTRTSLLQLPMWHIRNHSRAWRSFTFTITFISSFTSKWWEAAPGTAQERRVQTSACSEMDRGNHVY